MAIQSTAGGSLVTITLKTVSSGQWAVGSEEAEGVSLSLLTLVNQVNPTGNREFTTTLADSQGAFVVHIGNGQWAVNSGPLVVGDASMSVDQDVLHAQFTAHSPLPTAHFFFRALATAHFLEHVFPDDNGIVWEQSASLPPPAAPYLFVDDWAMLLDVVGIDAAPFQAPQAELPPALVQGPWAGDDPDMGLPK